MISWEDIFTDRSADKGEYIIKDKFLYKLFIRLKTNICL